MHTGVTLWASWLWADPVDHSNGRCTLGIRKDELWALYRGKGLRSAVCKVDSAKVRLDLAESPIVSIAGESMAGVADCGPSRAGPHMVEHMEIAAAVKPKPGILPTTRSLAHASL